jgi:ABC-type dipeptide/oligopeptide/nickel transport system permease component
MGGAVHGEFGNSWRLQPGVPVGELLFSSIPWTAALVVLAFVPLLIGAAGAAARWIPPQVDAVLQAVGLTPSVVFALCAAALVTIRYGAFAYDDEAMRVKLVLGALVLGLADQALSGAIGGVRGLMEQERRERYVQIAILRGEGVLSNTLPNTLGALSGQMRARLLHLLSGAVIVEVVIRIDGLGDLLWQGTLSQDFGVVLAAAFGFALLSAALLLLQAIVEVFTALHVRRSPAGVMQ